MTCRQSRRSAIRLPTGPYHAPMPGQSAFDIVIVGGGLVGSALACALEGSRLRIALIEAQAAAGTGDRAEAAATSTLDQRNLALARRSVETLERLGVWRFALPRAEPIRSVHVSRRGDFGAVRIGPESAGADALGHTVPAAALGAALETALAQCRDLVRLQPARVLDWSAVDDALELAIETAKGPSTLQTRLLVAADGTNSSMRARADIGVHQCDYAQTALVGGVALGREHHGRAYERFVEDGLIALLPMAGRQAGFVWIQPNAAAQAAMAWDDIEFAARLQQAFGHRAGAFGRIGRRQAWPLRSLKAVALAADRLVLVGNAAQTLHPVGAQGFNLGLRDAVTLADEITTAHAEARDIGGIEVLERHSARRLPDRDATLANTDALVKLMGSRVRGFGPIRSAAFAAIEHLPLLKRGLARRGMGYRSEGLP